MQVKIEITERELKKLVYNYLTEKLNMGIEEDDVNILVKASMNYKAEWEKGQFKATVDKIVD